MNLRYKNIKVRHVNALKNAIEFYVSYEFSCYNIVYYRYWRNYTVDGIYKDEFFGLSFSWSTMTMIENYLSGIKIKYKK